MRIISRNMTLRVAQCLRSSWLCSCAAAREIGGKQARWVRRRGLENLRALSASVRLYKEDKVTHTGQVRDKFGNLL